MTLRPPGTPLTSWDPLLLLFLSSGCIQKFIQRLLHKLLYKCLYGLSKKKNIEDSFENFSWNFLGLFICYIWKYITKSCIDSFKKISIHFYRNHSVIPSKIYQTIPLKNLFFSAIPLENALFYLEISLKFLIIYFFFFAALCCHWNWACLSST